MIEPLGGANPRIYSDAKVLSRSREELETALEQFRCIKDEQEEGK